MSRNLKVETTTLRRPRSKIHFEFVYALLGTCNRMKIFQVETEEGSSQEDQPSDSDEFDHFFD